VAALSPVLAPICDGRRLPRIATATVVRALVVMFLARLGSLNALEQTQGQPAWRRWLGQPLPSADSLGRIAALLDLTTLRQALGVLYRRLRQSKALQATSHGLTALVLDAHECHATYRRCCAGCLERRVRTKNGYRTQYYHRVVVAMLCTRPFPLLLDVEPLTESDGEIQAACRLLERVLRDYPRAFDVLLGDALYSDAAVYRLLTAHGKDVLTVLKRNTPELFEDAQLIFAHTPPTQTLPLQGGDRLVWDAEGFQSWPTLGHSVRVVRSSEATTVRRQLDGHKETLLTEWMWITTLSVHRAGTEAVVRLGHTRWDIENLGFNEGAHRWHMDHVYRHHPTALLACMLLAMIAYNLFHAFYYRNLHPALRRRRSYLHVARCIAAELYPYGSPPARPP
jgi:hypothetical protein